MSSRKWNSLFWERRNGAPRCRAWHARLVYFLSTSLQKYTLHRKNILLHFCFNSVNTPQYFDRNFKDTD